jgi:hypothetical protein
MKSTEQSKTLISYKFKFEGVEFLYYYDVIAVIKVLPEWNYNTFVIVKKPH